jgi:hypothetical protein
VSYLTNITAARDRLAEKLATESLNPRPNYSVGGRTVSWDTYSNSLVNKLEKLNQMVINANGAGVISTIVLS